MSAQKEFSLTRSQFAETQGITRENLKQRMRRGLYKNDYIFENGQYYFKSQEGVRENKGLYPGRIVPRKIKRKNLLEHKIGAISPPRTQQEIEHDI